jgi:hypothetical protein
LVTGAAFLAGGFFSVAMYVVLLRVDQLPARTADLPGEANATGETRAFLER